MKQRLVGWLLLILLLFPASLQANNQTGKFVLVIVDRVNLTELQAVATPRLDELVTRGAVGLMNTKTAGSTEPKDTYLTIGSSGRATAGYAGYLNFNQQELYQGIKAENIYQRRVGSLAAENQVVNLQLARLKKSNLQSNYQAKIGNLNTSLARANCQTAVLGNADTWQQPRRQIALIGFNKQGIVPGDVSKQMARAAANYPSGYLTNQDYLMQQFKTYYASSDLLIVETGDTSRVEAVKEELTPQKFRQAKVRAIKRADDLLGQIREEINLAHDYLMVATPTPAKEGAQAGKKLTLTVLVGPEIKSGLLTSETTKRPGLITNLDLAPTIYHSLTTGNVNFSGSKLTSVPYTNPVKYLAAQQQKIKTTFSWRPQLVQVFIWLQILVLFLSGFVLVYRKNITYLKQIAIILVISLLWLPSLFLLSKLFLSYSLLTAGFIWLGISCLLAVVSYRYSKNNLIPLVLPSLVLTGLLFFDLWGGSEWTKLSVFSYSPVIGARYYGLGNEFMGFLIGAFIVGTTGLKELVSEVADWIILLVLGLLVVTVGAPGLGTNFGGLITAAVVSSFVYLTYQGKQVDYKFLLRISLLVSGIIAVVILIEWFGLVGDKTHLGELLVNIRQNGIEELFLIIYRKLQINLRLLRETIWSRVLLAFLGVLIVLFQWPQGEIKDLLGEYPDLEVGLKGTILGSIVTMLVNDSGVVAAATLLLFPVFSLLYLGLIDKQWRMADEEWRMKNGG